MANNIRFPIDSVQGWGLIERGIREILSESNASDEMTTSICKKMRNHYDKFNVELSFSFSLPSCISLNSKDVEPLVQSIKEGTSKTIHQYTNQMLPEILKLEMQLYLALNPPSGTFPA